MVKKKSNSIRNTILIIILILVGLIIIYSVVNSNKDIRLSAVKCTSNTQCSNVKNEKVCAPNGECEQCKDDSHYCKDSVINPVCIVRSDGTASGSEYKCMQCRGDSDCSGSTWYDENLCNQYSCVCETATDCKSGNVCEKYVDSTGKRSQYGKCKTDQELKSINCKDRKESGFTFSCVGPGYIKGSSAVCTIDKKGTVDKDAKCGSSSEVCCKIPIPN